MRYQSKAVALTSGIIFFMSVLSTTAPGAPGTSASQTLVGTEALPIEPENQPTTTASVEGQLSVPASGNDTTQSVVESETGKAANKPEAKAVQPVKPEPAKPAAPEKKAVAPRKASAPANTEQKKPVQKTEVKPAAKKAAPAVKKPAPKPKELAKTNVSQLKETRPGLVSRIISATRGLVGRAMSWLGSRYVWGGISRRGVDCSGLTRLLYISEGVRLPHSAKQQFKMGIAVARQALLPGDLVFFNTTGPISHVGMYIGNDKFIHAANPKRGVRIDKLSSAYYSKRYAGARRFKSFS